MLKKWIKSTLRGAAILTVFPLLLSHWISGIAIGVDRSLESYSQLLSLLPGLTGNYLRVAFYRFALEHCDPTATICFGTLFSKAGARIGKHAYIGPRCMLGLVTLEADVLLGPSVHIPSGPKTHGIDQLDIPIRLQAGEKKRITIGQDTWIGANVVVLADVGRQAVVAAASTVTKPIQPSVIAAGTPASTIRHRQPTP